jgi:hypothetical protein
MSSPDIVATNRAFYDALWQYARPQRPDRFNTWPLVSQLLSKAPRRLELGPGLRPRLPIAGTHFVDLSPLAITELNARGGLAVPGAIGTLPYGDREFDLVCAFDVIEHVVLKEDGVLIFSVPVHADRWTEFDDWVGHARRYDPQELLALLASNGLAVEKSAPFGMQPSNTRWLKKGMWYLENRRRWAMFWYNWVGMPLAMLFQKPLKLATGLIDATGVDELLMVCRRADLSRGGK